jgi:hypothetical protein
MFTAFENALGAMTGPKALAVGELADVARVAVVSMTAVKPVSRTATDVVSRISELSSGSATRDDTA